MKYLFKINNKDTVTECMVFFVGFERVLYNGKNGYNVYIQACSESATKTKIQR